jgi:hypothetical protein
MGRGSRKENEINQHPRLTELYHICSMSFYHQHAALASRRLAPILFSSFYGTWASNGRGHPSPAARRSGRPEAPSVIQGSWHLRRASGLGLHGTRSRFHSRSARGVYSSVKNCKCNLSQVCFQLDECNDFALV